MHYARDAQLPSRLKIRMLAYICYSSGTGSTKGNECLLSPSVPVSHFIKAVFECVGGGGGGGAVWNLFSMSVGDFSSLCFQVSLVC